MTNGAVFTEWGFNAMLNRMWKDTPDYNAVLVFEIGSGTTTPSTADTSLKTPFVNWVLHPLGYVGHSVKPFQSVTFDVNNQTVTTTARIDTDEAVLGLITEYGEFMGLFGADGMVSHIVFNGVYHNAGETIDIVTVYKRSP